MHDHSSYLEASKGELIRTVNKLEDLSQSKVDVENEIKQLKENAEYLNSKKTEIDVFLNRQCSLNKNLYQISLMNIKIL